ncbi:Plasma kallikrein [Exaiptasia diaphana]|nr:Plasma kallikrein [Exaiptasia diaphana]
MHKTTDYYPSDMEGGELNLAKKDGDEQVMDIEKIIKHPNYDESKSPKFDYDITLLKLKKNINFNDKVRPICLPKKRFPDGENCYVTGWGYLKEFNKKIHKKPERSPILQQLELPLVSDKECGKRHRLTSRMICAGGTEGEDSCQGDSGGPLTCKNKSGIWDLAGVVSFGRGCARKNEYGVYSNVAELKGWVEDQIKKN